MTNINELEQRISAIEELLYKKGKIIDQQSFDLIKERRILGREVSLMKDEETAIPIKTSVPQNVGAPFPHVISCGLKTDLLFYIGTNRPDWDETANRIQVLDSQSKEYVARIQFNTYAIRFGGINDEVLHGHPLYEHGLESYEMHEIKNSSWIKEQKKINSVHPNFKNELPFWDLRKHYIFTFHNDIFECIAENYDIQVYRANLDIVINFVNKTNDISVNKK